MKKLLFLSLLAILTIQAGWTPVSNEQKEYEAIMWKIAAIRERGAAMNTAPSSGVIIEPVFQLLKNIGSPVSYKILQEMCASGDLPKSFLNRA